MIEAVDSGIGDERRQSGFIRMKGPDAHAIARLCFRPQIVGLGKQPAGVESCDLDGKPCSEDQMRDRLILDAEAGGEQYSPGHGGTQRSKSLRRGGAANLPEQIAAHCAAAVVRLARRFWKMVAGPSSLRW